MSTAKVDRHPLMVMGHVFSSVAIVLCAAAVALMLIGAVLAERSVFLAGGVAMLAGVVLELRAKALARYALEASPAGHSADARVTNVVEHHN